VVPSPCDRHEVRRCVLLYLTAHPVMPRDEFQRSVAAFRNPGKVAPSFFWLGWAELWSVIAGALARETDPLRRRILDDLRELLMRKAFVPFRGFVHLQPMSPGSVPRWRRSWGLRAPCIPSARDAAPAKALWTRFGHSPSTLESWSAL